MRILSGLQPSGRLHIGNYFGMMQAAIQLQHEGDAYYFIADYHSLTSVHDGKLLRSHVRDLAIDFLACGLDPSKCVLFRQSDVPEHCELSWILSTVTPMGLLERCHSYKDKVANGIKPSHGLFAYPVLMAADILIHRGQKVPVGKDQEQNLEMARNFAQRFNHFYKVDWFPEPQPYRASQSSELIKVPGLDGSGKMGKSEGEGNAIFLAEDPSSIRKKIMRAVTDTGPTQPNSTPEGAVANLYSLLGLVSSSDVVEEYRDAYANCTIRYGDLKKQLAEDMVSFLAPLRERILELESQHKKIEEIRQYGAEKARRSAVETLHKVREIMGF
jgi:tryptophanyl-tRNA synthetase